MVFDRKDVFIGSMNLDPRSGDINTEAGLYIESPELAAQVIAYMDEGCYRKTLTGSCWTRAAICTGSPKPTGSQSDTSMTRTARLGSAPRCDSYGCCPS